MVSPHIAQIKFAGNYSPITARISPMVCIPRIRFFFKVILLPPKLRVLGIRNASSSTACDKPLHCCAFLPVSSYFPCQISFSNLSLSYAPYGARCVHDQKQSERISVLPYSSIALTRSCFTFFFIAIPPKQFYGCSAFESFHLASCNRVFICCA